MPEDKGKIKCSKQGCREQAFKHYQFCWQHLPKGEKKIFVGLLVKPLSEFMRPEEFLAIVRKTAPVPAGYFFSNDFKEIREAWAAGHFALGLEQAYGPIEVRLIEEEFPDFLLRIYKEYKFEFTVALEPGRQVHKEYKNKEKGPSKPIGFDPEPYEQKGPSWIAEAVERKIKKRYSERTHLLVYAQFPAFTHYLDPVEIAKSCEKFSNSFSSIWILRDNYYLLLYDTEKDVFGKTDHKWHRIEDNPWQMNGA